MQNFNIEKRGFNKEEVKRTIEHLIKDYEKKLSNQRDRIFELKDEVEKLEKELKVYKSKDKNISSALIEAVKTAKEIEKTSKGIHELEIRRVRVLYNRWEEFLEEMMQKYPEIGKSYDPQLILDSFKKAIDQTVEENFNSMKVTKKVNNQKAKVGIQGLLSRMNRPSTMSTKVRKVPTINPANATYNNINTAVIKRNARPKVSSMNKVKANNQYLEESKRIGDISKKIKPITELTLTYEDKYDNLVDKYLHTNNVESETFANNAYGKQVVKKTVKKQPAYSLYPEPNSTGFDLQEALNPTEGLIDIMKAFDFFDDNDDKQ